MVDVVLVNPEIPPNTGNVIRLCANTGTPLHLVEPLGFLAGRQAVAARGAGLPRDGERDRAPGLGSLQGGTRQAGGCSRSPPGDACGSTRSAFRARRRPGLRGGDGGAAGGDSSPDSRAEDRVRLPMVAGNRSLNLSNAVAVAVFEAWRQAGYPGGA